MRLRFLAVLVAASVLATAASAAIAGRLEFGSPERGFLAPLSELRLEFVFNGNLYTVTCPVTLAGSFHSRTIVKTPGTLVGFVTRSSAAEASCRGTIGREAPYALSMHVLAETLPWHMTYSSFYGMLPSIRGASVRIAGAAFEVRGLIFEQTCLFRSTALEPLWLRFDREARGVITSTTIEVFAIPFASGSPLCGRESALTSGGGGRATQLSGASLILTLI